MIMPRLSFEEPKGGPLAKAARAREQAEQREERDDDATVLFEQFTDEPGDEPEIETAPRGNRDTVVVVLRAATVAVAIALVGFIVLLTTAGGDEDPAAGAPGVPEIATSHEPSTGPTTSTPPLGAIVAPPVHSQTAEIVPPPAVTQPTVTTNPQSGGPQPQFVRPGEPCDTPGAYAFTESFQPMVCDGGRRGEKLAWRRMFR
jgi:hypothetical protein